MSEPIILKESKRTPREVVVDKIATLRQTALHRREEGERRWKDLKAEADRYDQDANKYESLLKQFDQLTPDTMEILARFLSSPYL